jgi:hypothetical protein
MRHFKVVNFETFQHYKKRRPPWIKLYNSLLDDYSFSSLPDATKYHFCAITLLASRYDNKIPYDPEFLAKQINATEKVNLDALQVAGFIELIEDASNSLAECKQNATLETEREAEAETEREDSVSDETEQSSQIENLDFENVFKGPPDPAKENTHSVFIGRLKDIFKGDRAVKNSKAAWQWVSKEWLRVLQKYDPDEEWRRKQLSFEHRLYQVLNEFVEDGRPFDFAAANAKLRNPRFDEQQKRSDAAKQQDQRAGSNLFNEFPEGG